MLTIRVTSSFGETRLVHGVDQWEVLNRVGFAMFVAETTARPAYREMIDDLRWDEMR